MIITRSNTAALVRRVADARRRRQIILNRKEPMRGRLPDWAREPLLQVGMSAAELDELVSDDPGLARQQAMTERELRTIDAEIEELEAELSRSSCSSLGEVQAVLDLTLDYVAVGSSSPAPTEFHEHHGSRVFDFLKIAADSLRGLLAAERRLAS